MTGYTTAKVTALHGLIHSELLDRHGRDHTAAYADANIAGVKQIADNVSELEIDCDFERMEAYTYAESADGAEKLALRACNTDQRLELRGRRGLERVHERLCEYFGREQPRDCNVWLSLAEHPARRHLAPRCRIPIRSLQQW